MQAGIIMVAGLFLLLPFKVMMHFVTSRITIVKHLSCRLWSML